MKVVTVSAPGKTILHGEHAVVFGKGAIAVSLGLRTTVSLHADSGSKLEVKLQSLNYERSWNLPGKISLNDLGESESDVIPASSDCLKEISETFQTDLSQGSKNDQAVTTILYLYSAITQKYGNGSPKSVVVNVSSELPIGAGLGSSASYAVTLSAAFLGLYNAIQMSLPLSTDYLNLINEWAFQAETIMHGKPSGIDNSICTYGGALFFQLGKIVERLHTLPDIQILLINTEVPRNTKQLVINAREKISKYPEVFEPILKSIEAISLKQWTYLKEVAALDHGKQDVPVLNDLVDINHHLLNSIGAGHPKLDQICQLANSLGLAAKLTGAGGGGCALVFLNKDTDVGKTSDLFRREGFTVYAADLSGKGVSFH